MERQTELRFCVGGLTTPGPVLGHEIEHHLDEKQIDIKIKSLPKSFSLQ
jgi:hypothetical protein